MLQALGIYQAFCSVLDVWGGEQNRCGAYQILGTFVPCATVLVPLGTGSHSFLLFSHLWHCIFLILLLFLTLFLFLKSYSWVPFPLLYYLNVGAPGGSVLAHCSFHNLYSPENLFHFGDFRHHVCCLLIFKIGAPDNRNVSSKGDNLFNRT